jgi:diadenosine tetraphosphate (Ap4A) HIT family hydrolase
VNTPAERFVLHDRLAADSRAVAELPLCMLRLMDDANYPWLILVPRLADARELLDLDAAQQAQLLAEINQASRLLRRLFSPHKLNIAALGNVVSQLHVHVVARYTDDAAWPAPVWGREPARPYSDDALAERIAALQRAIADGVGVSR